jgi:glutaredoxin
MRSFAIAAVMTALVAGLGYALVPAARDPSEAKKNAIAARGELAAESAAQGDDSANAESEPEASATPAASKRTFFQWTDERGTVRFARSLDEVPPAWRERAGQIEVDSAAYVPKPRAQASATRKPYSNVPELTGARFADVTVYTAPWCGWCRKTLAWLDERDVDYTNKDIEESEEYAAELVQKSGGRSIPFVEIDGTQIRGYNPNEMAALLE